jgi:hypothetical protein
LVPHLHHVTAHCLDLLQVSAHLVVQLRKPISHPELERHSALGKLVHVDRLQHTLHGTKELNNVAVSTCYIKADVLLHMVPLDERVDRIIRLIAPSTPCRKGKQRGNMLQFMHATNTIIALLLSMPARLPHSNHDPLPPDQLPIMSPRQVTKEQEKQQSDMHLCNVYAA